ACSFGEAARAFSPECPGLARSFCLRVLRGVPLRRQPELISPTRGVMGAGNLTHLGRESQVKGLGTRKRFEAEAGQRAAAPRVLDPGPCQRGVEVVAAVHEP